MRKLSLLLLLCVSCCLFTSLAGSALAQTGDGWDDPGDGWDGTLPTVSPSPIPTPTPKSSDQVINNEYSMLPMLTLLVVVVIGGLVLTAFRGNLDGPQLVTGIVIIILVGLGAAVAVSILAGIQTVTQTWCVILFFTR